MVLKNHNSFICFLKLRFLDLVKNLFLCTKYLDYKMLSISRIPYQSIMVNCGQLWSIVVCYCYDSTIITLKRHIWNFGWVRWVFRLLLWGFCLKATCLEEILNQSRDVGPMELKDIRINRRKWNTTSLILRSSAKHLWTGKDAAYFWRRQYKKLFKKLLFSSLTTVRFKRIHNSYD